MKLAQEEMAERKRKRREELKEWKKVIERICTRDDVLEYLRQRCDKDKQYESVEEHYQAYIEAMVHFDVVKPISRRDNNNLSKGKQPR
eukprot:442221-Hanusia_phi.AAC.2